MSVMGEYAGSQFVKNYNPVVETLLFDQIIFDDHTMPQYYFFDDIKYQYGTQYFYHDSTLVTRMAQCYNLQLDQEFEGNKTESNINKKIMMDFLRSRIDQNKNLFSAIRSKYKEDYRLINTVQFQ